MNKTNALKLDDLLSDPLLREYCGTRIDTQLLRLQLHDTRLTGRNLDEFVSMDDDELVTHAFTNASAVEAELPRLEEAVPEEETFEEDPDDPETGGLGGCVTERITVLVETMGVEAKIILNKPGEGEPPPDVEEIQNALARAGVVQGLHTEYILRLASRPIYGYKFKIAEGKAPVDGTDGKATFYFDTSVDLTPAINEDGSADYRSLDYVKNVHEGDVLCEMTPPTAGEDGYSVLGDTLPGKAGKPAEVFCGMNTQLSADNRKIIAACDGQVYLRDNKIIVRRVLMVDKVDASTGNILFVGTVHVRGDVAPGFTIRAGGDIIVKGVVEGAILVSGSNIVLCSGMKGKGGGLLDARENIRAIFVENAKLRANKSIYADVVMNSVVECGDTLSLSGENGRLLGGTSTAGKSIRAYKIGSDANVATALCIKDMTADAAKRSELHQKLERYERTVSRLKVLPRIGIEGGKSGAELQILVARVVIIKVRLERAMRSLEKQITESSRATHADHAIVVKETLYPNATLEIDGCVSKNMRLRYSCAATVSKGKIVFNSARYYD